MSCACELGVELDDERARAGDHAASCSASSAAKPPGARASSARAPVSGEAIAWSRERGDGHGLEHRQRLPRRRRPTRSGACAGRPAARNPGPDGPAARTPRSGARGRCRSGSGDVSGLRTRGRRLPGPARRTHGDPSPPARCRLDSCASSATLELVTSVSQPLRTLMLPLQPSAVSTVSSAARCGFAIDTRRRCTQPEPPAGVVLQERLPGEQRALRGPGCGAPAERPGRPPTTRRRPDPQVQVQPVGDVDHVLVDRLLAPRRRWPAGCRRRPGSCPGSAPPPRCSGAAPRVAM